MSELESQYCLSSVLETLTRPADSKGGSLCPEDEILTFLKIVQGTSIDIPSPFLNKSPKVLLRIKLEGGKNKM